MYRQQFDNNLFRQQWQDLPITKHLADNSCLTDWNESVNLEIIRNLDNSIICCWENLYHVLVCPFALSQFRLWKHVLGLQNRHNFFCVFHSIGGQRETSGKCESARGEERKNKKNRKTETCSPPLARNLHPPQICLRSPKNVKKL